ncbi:Exocyst complex component SEC5 [Lachancea thermotolerans]
MGDSAFTFGARELCDFYQLKDLDPKVSWVEDSSVVYSLSQPQNADSIDSSYAVLNELLRQEHEHSTERNDTIETAGLSDPLNSSTRLEDLLDHYRIPQDERYKYYINSKKFNSKLYLKQLHAQDSFKDLSLSLDHLDQSLQAQSEDLKQLVQRNFVKYVRSKNNLDRIYEQFNKFSLGESRDFGTDDLGETVDESIREITIKVKPILDISTKRRNAQTTIAFLQDHKQFFDAPKKLKHCLIEKDFANLVVEYNNAHSTFKDLQRRGFTFPILTKIWDDIENTICHYREVIWDSLVNLVAGETQEQILPLISKLLDLNYAGNPIIEWINTKLDIFERKIGEVCSQMFTKIIQSQKKIVESALNEKVDLTFYLSIKNLADKLNDGQVSRFGIVGSSFLKNPGLCDTVVVVEMWLLISKFINLLSKESSDFVEFWGHVEKFLDGTYQTSLMNDKRKDDILGSNTQTRDDYGQFLEMKNEQIRCIRRRGEDFLKRLCENLSNFFNASQDTLSTGSIPEKETGIPLDYGFLPPNSNCLSCLRYLPRIVEPILKFTTELAQLNVSSSSIEFLRETNALVLERSISAISATKLRDISSFHTLEDWSMYRTSGSEEYGITQFPEVVQTFQNLSITTVRNMLYSYEKLPVLNGIYVVTHPSRKILAGIEVQQIVSMEAVLESILKEAAKEKENPRNPRTILTLTNLQYIKGSVFPQVLRYFDESFETQLSRKNLEIFTLLAKMETSILGNYLSDLKVTLRDILEERFYEINWAAYNSNSFRVGDYIIEALMVLVGVHSECFKIAPQLIGRILRESQVFISKYLFEAFKPYAGNLSSDGLLQVVVDLQFFLRVLSNMLETTTEATINATLQNCFENDLDRMQRCIKETEPIVSANLEKTSVQFASFK